MISGKIGKIGSLNPSSWNWLVTRKSLLSGLSKSNNFTVFSSLPSPKFWVTVIGSNPPDLDKPTSLARIFSFVSMWSKVYGKEDSLICERA